MRVRPGRGNGQLHCSTSQQLQGHCPTLTLHCLNEAAQDVEDLVDVHQVLGFQPRPKVGKGHHVKGWVNLAREIHLCLHQGKPRMRLAT